MILPKGQYDLSTFIQPLNHKEGIFVTPYNVRYLATYLHPNADIQGRVIHFGHGTTSQEKLLEIPLGEVDQSRLTIIITVGLGKSHPNTPGTDSDLDVGISDGTNQNLMRISDKDNYSSLPPCRPIDGTHDDFRVSTGTTVSSTLKLTFIPFYRYGACETAQEGGYINTGTFNSFLNTNKPLFLHLSRDEATEEYFIHYLRVELV